MTEPRAVYAYLDLAETELGHCAVPMSNGREQHFAEPECVVLDRYREAETRFNDYILVRGPRAIEVAEREVDACQTALIKHSCADKNCAELDAALKRAVDLRDRLRARLAYRVSDTDTARSVVEEFDRKYTAKTISAQAGVVQSVTHVLLPLTLATAKDLGVCRLCGMLPEHGPGLPFVYDFGKEHAHEACLRQRDTVVISVHVDIQGPLIASCDALDTARRVGAAIAEAVKKESPMPFVNFQGGPKKSAPDTHASCRFAVVDGKLLDDYGRPVLNTRWSIPDVTPGMPKLVDADVVLMEEPPDPAARPGKMLCVELSIHPSEGDSVAEELTAAIGRPVTVLPKDPRCAPKSMMTEKCQLIADISRRADLGATQRRAFRAGAFCAALTIALALTAARVAPEAWRWLAGHWSTSVVQGR